MLESIKYRKPEEIEKKSFEIITENLKGKVLTKETETIIKRVIHTTADFEYADTLKISKTAVESALKALKSGCHIVTDTTMAMSGINKRVLSSFGGQCHCYIGEKEVADKAKEKGITRSVVSIDKAAEDKNNKIYVIGNAPTALIRLYELIKEDKIAPVLIVGVPVGFVNVVESKKLIMETSIDYIVAEGRKGGSTVAAAIINALLYMASEDRRE